MARRTVGLLVTSPSIVGGESFHGTGHIPDVVNTVATTATVAALAAVVSDVAVLVADAASPTQAHVTTLDGHLTTLNSAWATLLAATGAVPVNKDVILSYDTTAVGNRSTLRKAVNALLDRVAATDDFTG